MSAEAELPDPEDEPQTIEMPPWRMWMLMVRTLGLMTTLQAAGRYLWERRQI